MMRPTMTSSSSSPAMALKAMLVKAWSERWSEVHFGIHVKNITMANNGNLDSFITCSFHIMYLKTL